MGSRPHVLVWSYVIHCRLSDCFTELEALARKVDWNYMTALAALKSVRSGSPSLPSVEPAAATNRESSLLRPPSRHAPDGCYCQPGRCSAPIIMGGQMPCRDPQKASAAIRQPLTGEAYWDLIQATAKRVDQWPRWKTGGPSLPTPEPPKEETDENKGLPE